MYAPVCTRFRSYAVALPARLEADHVPWCTYTDPELAQVGLSEAEARTRHGAGVRVLRAALAVSSTLQIDDVLHQLVDSAAKALGARAAAIRLIDETGERLEVRAAPRPHEQRVRIVPVLHHRVESPRRHQPHGRLPSADRACAR